MYSSIWPDGQAAKTTPSHGVNPGSIPGQVISPNCGELKSNCIRPDGQAAKTTPSHGVNPGSIPGQVISPNCGELKSNCIRPDGQAAKTTPSHGVNPGSIPGQVIGDEKQEEIPAFFFVCIAHNKAEASEKSSGHPGFYSLCCSRSLRRTRSLMLLTANFLHFQLKNPHPVHHRFRKLPVFLPGIMAHQLS